MMLRLIPFNMFHNERGARWATIPVSRVRVRKTTVYIRLLTNRDRPYDILKRDGSNLWVITETGMRLLGCAIAPHPNLFTFEVV